MGKIIQIIFIPSNGQYQEHLIALSDDGNLWACPVGQYSEWAQIHTGSEPVKNK